MQHNRLVNGDKLWKSKKIGHCRPTSKAEYPWLLPLADPNGNFELDFKAIHAQCYQATRPEISIQDLKEIIRDFQRNGLLFTWTENGNTYCHFTNIEKGQLPGPVIRKRLQKVDVRRIFVPETPDPEVEAYISQCKAAWETNEQALPFTTTIDAEVVLPAQLPEHIDAALDRPRCRCCQKTFSELVPISVWAQFVGLRRSLRRPLTDDAVDQFEELLFKLHEEGEDVIERVLYSVRAGYPDIYPSRNGNGNGNSTAFLTSEYGPIKPRDAATQAAIEATSRKFLEGKSWPKPKL